MDALLKAISIQKWILNKITNPSNLIEANDLSAGLWQAETLL